MPGQRVKADILKKIVELKSNGVSNRAIASTFNVNRNTINSYVKLYNAGLLDDQFKVKETRSYLDRERLIEFCGFVIQEKKANLNLLKLWREYKSTHENGYSYTHFCNLLNYLEASITLRKTIRSPVLFSGKVKDGVINKATGEITPAFIMCLLFPSSGLYIISKYTDLDINSIITFLELSFRNLNGRPYQLALSYSLLGAKFNSKTIDTLSDWLSLNDIKSIIPPKKSMTREPWKTIEKHWSTICKIAKATNESNSLIESNFTEKLSFGLNRSILFSAFDRSSLSELPLFFAGARKIISAKVQKMSHLFLPEDKHYYSVPSKYIGQNVSVKYCSETVTICQNGSIICSHNRNASPYKYTTDKLHLKGGKGWTQEYFIKQASGVGPSTKSFIQKLINQYDSPNAGYKQANAILLLKNTYQRKEIESACGKILPIGPHTYHRLKRELELSLTFG